MRYLKDSDNQRNYWKVLKYRLAKEGGFKNMKIKRFTRLVMIMLSSFVLVSCNMNYEDIIRINGEVNSILEVGENYIDEGVTHPEKYVLVSSGEVNSNKLGTYEIKYSVFTDRGELVKELFRFIKVVDTQKPVYTEKIKLHFCWV